MKKKMKILAAGDIHGDSSIAKRLAQRAKKEKVDLVILAGDLTFFEASEKGLIAPFEKAKKKVLLIPGNHETIATADFLTEIYSNAKNIHGYSVKVGDIGIFGTGGANIGPFSRMKESELYDNLKKGFDNLKNVKTKIMVTHVPPSPSLVDKFMRESVGSSGVKKAIKKFQPDIAISSHIHEASGIEENIGKTKMINVGREGRIIEI